MSTMTTQELPLDISKPRFCSSWVVAAEGEFSGICMELAGHAGEHRYEDDMGMCGDSHCRAQEEWHRPYASAHLLAIQHTH